MVAAAVVAAFVPAAPADASISGTLAFTCVGTFQYPRVVGAGSCPSGVSAIPSIATVHLSGIDAQGDVYTAIGLGTMSASFTYSAPCVGTVVTAATANGTLTVSGLTAVHGTTIVGATLTSNFTMVAPAPGGATFLLSNTRVYFSNGHFAASVMPFSGIVDGIGTGTFVPLRVLTGCTPMATEILMSGAISFQG